MDILKLANCGGCTAKLPPGKLKQVLQGIPSFNDPNLLIGFDTSDDAAVYKISDDLAIIKTLDFFPPITDDPYLFGKIAAANALSDVYAMGGTVKLALNIVCFPEGDDPLLLGEILRGGAEKVMEAGGILCGGHSIHDEGIKYGLSVTGLVHPDKIYANNRCCAGDDIILTKPLGIGIIMAAYTAYQQKNEAYQAAVKSMETLNKHAAAIATDFNISACTDVTGFGFLGHLNEMASPEYTIAVCAEAVPYIPKAYEYAEGFILTAAGQRNRKSLYGQMDMQNIDEPLAEILFDPQTSGGLLIALSKKDSPHMLERLRKNGIDAAVVASVVSRGHKNIIVYRS